ncbi:MAG: hypothetical protein JJE04_01430 [Acidobacteriia bacterium]|nr:hypothetical protein [Terriglobia bacterium]
MRDKALRSSLFRFVLISVAGSGLASAQPVLLAPTPCEALDVKSETNSKTLTKVSFENRTDATLNVFRVFPDGKRSQEFKLAGTTGLPARYAAPRYGKPGAVWVVEDDAGKCLGGYTAGTQEGRVRIGDKELRVRRNVPPYRLKTVVFPGFGVKPDRNEAFIDSQNVSSTVCDGLNLWVGARTRDSACGGPAQQESDRYLEFDLRQPVAASSAISLGVIRDPKAGVHVFLSHNHERRFIVSVQELPAGEEAQSELVEFALSIDGVKHILLVGPWGPGLFNPRQKKQLHGEGTSRRPDVQGDPEARVEHGMGSSGTGRYIRQAVE